MTKSMAAALGTAIIFAGAVSAYAQETKPIGLSIRAGLFFPSNGDARDAEGSSWFAGGLEYKIRDFTVAGLGEGYLGSISLSVDTLGKGDVKNVPVLLNYVGRKNELFYSVGLGANFSSFDDGSGGDSRTRLGYQFGVGYDFQHGKTPLFLEAKYWGCSKSQFNGFAIYAGIRL
jgi:hypothetical protein